MSTNAFEVVRDYVDLNGQGERAAALELVGENIEVQVPPSVPWGGVTHGRDAYAKRASEAGAFIKLDPGGVTRVLDAGEVALLTFDGTATAVATGRSFDHRLRELFTVEEGKITKLEIVYWDVALILDAIANTQ